jgi:sugar phosphate isomerase/epimerase
VTISRREFVGAAAGFAVAGRMAWANPLGLPLGIQLYSVRTQMATDLDEALAAVRAAGFTEVEAAALPKKPVAEIRAALEKAGLKCVSSHRGFADLTQKFNETVAYDQALGCKFIICPGPGYRTPGSKGEPTLDDWHYNAETFNTIGEKMNKAGLRFGYHNHSREFVATAEGKIPYFELLALTDPKKVTFEMDCGWVVVGGHNPVELMQTYPHRFAMLHVKDFKLPAGTAPGKTGGPIAEPKVTELGMGGIDYKPVFAQARKNQTIAHAFVEQEAFDMPWKDSLKVDGEYMRKL